MRLYSKSFPKIPGSNRSHEYLTFKNAPTAASSDTICAAILQSGIAPYRSGRPIYTCPGQVPNIKVVRWLGTRSVRVRGGWPELPWVCNLWPDCTNPCDVPPDSRINEACPSGYCHLIGEPVLLTWFAPAHGGEVARRGRLLLPPMQGLGYWWGLNSVR